MKSYSELLKDPRWQKKRLEILNRDGWACTKCRDKKNTLHVHHTEYRAGKKPWEYPKKCLETLCENCHKVESEIKIAIKYAKETIEKTFNYETCTYDLKSISGCNKFIWNFYSFLLFEYPSDLNIAKFYTEIINVLMNYLGIEIRFSDGESSS